MNTNKIQDEFFKMHDAYYAHEITSDEFFEWKDQNTITEETNVRGIKVVTERIPSGNQNGCFWWVIRCTYYRKSDNQPIKVSYISGMNGHRGRERESARLVEPDGKVRSYAYIENAKAKAFELANN